MKTAFMKNWKTNALAVVAIVVVGLYIHGDITTEQLVATQGFLIGMGLAASKDNDQ